MFDLGMTELLVIGVVALIVVGPKDLPVLFRKVGEFVGKMRGMAREFSRAMNDAADESGMKGDDFDLRKLTNPASSAFDAVKDAAKSATDFDPSSATGQLSAERAEAAAKIQAKAARAAAERKAKEAQEALERADKLEAEVPSATAAAAAKAEPKTDPGAND